MTLSSTRLCAAAHLQPFEEDGGDGVQRVLRPRAEPVDGHARDERGKLPQTRANRLPHRREAQHAVQVALHLYIGKKACRARQRASAQYVTISKDGNYICMHNDETTAAYPVNPDAGGWTYNRSMFMSKRNTISDVFNATNAQTAQYTFLDVRYDMIQYTRRYAVRYSTMPTG
eukprot:1195219-Prorocentrum_minimum.AAC.1